MEATPGRLAAVLKISLGKLAESKDSHVLISEIAAWNDLTPHEVGKMLAKAGLTSMWLRKQGEKGKGYTKLKLSNLTKKLDDVVVESEEVPTRDWGCTDCFTVFESREKKPSCPACSANNCKVVPPTRAPAIKSGKTAFADRMIQTALDDYGLTDYSSKDHTPEAMAMDPGAFSPDIGKSVSNTPVVDMANRTMRPAAAVAPGAMSLALNRGTGEAKLDPYGRTVRGMVSEMSGGRLALPRKKGTVTVAADRRPLPPVAGKF